MRANVRGTRDDQAICDVDRFAGRDRRVERHLQHRPIVGVAVVGRDEAQPRRQIAGGAAAPISRTRGDVDPAPVATRDASASGASPASARSRIHVDSVLRQAL